LRRLLLSIPRFVAIALIAIALLGVSLWWRSAILSLMNGSPVSNLQTFSVLLTAKENRAEIGWKDIGQEPGANSAEERHFELALDADNGVTVRNIARTKKLWLSFAGKAEDSFTVLGRKIFRFDTPFETFAERIVIPRGAVSRLYVLGGSATFRNVSASSFEMEVKDRAGASRTYRYDPLHGSSGLEFTGEQNWDPACKAPSWDARLRRRAVSWGDQLKSRIFALFKRNWVSGSEIDVAVLGGGRDCIEDGRRQIGNVGNLGWRELKVVRRGETFLIAPYESADRNKLPIAFAEIDSGGQPKGQRRSFSKVEWRIDDGSPWGGVSAIIAGKTEYAVTLCRGGDARPLCRQQEAVPNNAVRALFRPTGKVPLFNLAECSEPDRKDSCPSPIDVGSATKKCDENNTRCWQWSNQRNALFEAAGSSALSRLSIAERLLRIGVAGIAVLLIIGFAFSTRNPLVRGRQGLTVLSRMPAVEFRWTLLSVLLALAPELSGLAGMPLDARWALTIMLCNWGLVGLVLLTGPNGRALGLLWVAVTILAAIGSTTLAAMAIDGNTSAWSQYFVRQKYLFLDLVPPVILAVAACPARVMRAILQELVVGVRPRYRIILWLPSIALVVAFGLWLVMGSQTGLGAFQPVEAGKFAVVILTAAALLGIDPDIRRTALSRNALARTISFVALLLFFAFLITVPALRRDWSPALIMCLLVAGLVAAFIIPLCWRILASAWRRRVTRYRVPLAFRPKPRRRFFRVVTLAYVAPILVVIGLMSAAPMFQFVATWWLNLEEWSENIDRRLFALESGSLAGGRRLVTERIIAWVDLSLAKPPSTDCRNELDEPLPVRAEAPSNGKAARKPSAPSKAAPAPSARSCYRDLEWQLIRSRKVIARAECGINQPLDPAQSSVLRRADAVWRVMASPMTLAASLLQQRPICGKPETETAAAQSELDVVQPIRIPVVESDFTGAYLIGRLGVGAATLFYAAQILLLAMVVYTFMRISSARNGNLMDAGLRRFIATVVAGVGLLLMLQWILAWSNILGLLPVMGQPMTLLSYAVSHHLLMVLPCLIVLVVGLRYISYDRAKLVPRGVPRRNRWAFFS
jgi:cell division protein FtsW (lipid II flippase)